MNQIEANLISQGLQIRDENTSYNITEKQRTEIWEYVQQRYFPKQELTQELFQAFIGDGNNLEDIEDEMTNYYHGHD